MKIPWAVICAVFGAAVTAEAGDSLPASMASSKLDVRFDAATREPEAMVHVETGDRLALKPESAFRIEFYKIAKDIAALAEAVRQNKAELLAVDARDCRPGSASQETSPDGAVVRTIPYTGPHGKVTVTYTLGRDDHFIQKALQFEPAFAEPYLLWRVEAQRFRLATKPKEVVPFVHGGCVTHFLRMEKGGFMAGIQLPLMAPLAGFGKILPIPAEAKLDPDGTNALAYAVNFRFAAKEPYAGEKVFWGCYRRTGIAAPKVPSLIKGGHGQDHQSDIPPDLGESEAMLAMVRRLAPPVRHGIKVTLNGWESKLTRNGYGAKANPQEIENDKRILAAAKENLGDFEVTLAGVWGGLHQEISRLTPADTAPPESPAAKGMLEWARSQKIGINMWSTHAGPNPWSNLMAYCPQHAAWQAKGFTCPANRDYMRWHGNLVAAMVRRGYASYAQDEHYALLAGQMRCDSSDHDHLPGNAGYGWFRLRQELYRALRKEFGKDFPIHGYRPQMDLGIWECLPVDTIFTMNEFPPVGGDRIRYWSRIRHDYHFLPSYMDQALVNHRYTDTDMLSALAVSSTYLIYGTGDATAKKWLTWARAHPEHMGAQSIFLPDWPGSGKCDAYLRLVNGSGFAFLFNGNKAEAEAEIPLDASVGLDPARSYVLTRIFPEGAAEKERAKGRWTAKLPPGAAWLVSVEPTRNVER
jgi:hypothetical protein